MGSFRTDLFLIGRVLWLHRHLAVLLEPTAQIVGGSAGGRLHGHRQTHP